MASTLTMGRYTTTLQAWDRHAHGTFTSEAFDADGNRTSYTGTGSGTYTTGTGNQTLGDGTYGHAYDSEGNLTSRTNLSTGNATLYKWDTRNRLTEVDQVVGGVQTTLAVYTYDALNRLIKAVDQVGGVTTTRATLYDGQTPLIDFDASGTATARYLSVPGAIDQVLARDNAGTVAWYLDDREGTVRDLVDTTGEVIDHIDYSAFGTVTGETAPSLGDRFKYAGMELDTATGLSYDRARWYDASGGKFIGQDPIGFAGGDANIYRYTGNGPTNFTDPSGLAPPAPGGYWGGGWNPANWGRWALAGDPNASDRNYNAAIEGYGAGYTRAYNDQSAGAIVIMSAGARVPGPIGYLSAGVNVTYQTVLDPNTHDGDASQQLAGLPAVVPPKGPGGKAAACPAPKAEPNFTKEMLSKSEVIARGRDIRKIDEIVDKFGGTRKGWVKKKGLDSSGQEWHWYEHNGIGRVGEKPAGSVDPF